MLVGSDCNLRADLVISALPRIRSSTAVPATVDLIVNAVLLEAKTRRAEFEVLA